MYERVLRLRFQLKEINLWFKKKTIKCKKNCYNIFKKIRITGFTLNSNYTRNRNLNKNFQTFFNLNSLL